MLQAAHVHYHVRSTDRVRTESDMTRAHAQLAGQTVVAYFAVSGPLDHRAIPDQLVVAGVQRAGLQYSFSLHQCRAFPPLALRILHDVVPQRITTGQGFLPPPACRIGVHNTSLDLRVGAGVMEGELSGCVGQPMVPARVGPHEAAELDQLHITHHRADRRVVLPYVHAVLEYRVHRVGVVCTDQANGQPTE